MLLYIPFASFVLSLHSLCFILPFRCCSRLLAFVAVSSLVHVFFFFHLFLWNFCVFRFILNFIFCWLCVRFCATFRIYRTQTHELSVWVGCRSDSMLQLNVLYFSSLDSIQNPDAGCCHTFSAVSHSLGLYHSVCMLGNSLLYFLFVRSFHSTFQFSLYDNDGIELLLLLHVRRSVYSAHIHIECMRSLGDV